jgi:hypothetical protein
MRCGPRSLPCRLRRAIRADSVVGMRRVPVIVTVLVAAVLGSLPLDGQASPSAVAGAAPTAVVHLRPIDRHGRELSGYTITKQRKHAHCVAGSQATGTAYRCFSGNRILDPCWVQKPKRFAVCLAEPWSFRLIQLKVTGGYHGKLPKRHAALPWGVQLADGEQCLIAQGASGAVGGKRINYFCAHTKNALYGKVDTRHHAWRVHKATPTGGGRYRKAGRVTLSKAWFGKPSRQA